MSLGTGCKRFTCVVGGDAGRGDCDLFARNVSFLLSCSEEDTRVRGLLSRDTAASANLNVFFNREAMVMGPTPPGTGVIFEATREALAKSTSPTSRRPDFRDASGMKFVPTSTTTAPGFNQDPLTNWAWPTAATTMSASLTILLMFLVLEWTTVTVASLAWSKAATGMPTMFERPTTTALLPAMTTLDRSSNSKHPTGVHATALGSSPPLKHNFPTFNAANPSASLSTDIAAKTRPSFI
mmetsp:Transcript_5871/g.16568  ORF Transcript_5871/g.16568 Transcript_5871/m.16568 type:complete len:239 (-) Transcript_5871:585-1301(-)